MNLNQQLAHDVAQAVAHRVQCALAAGGVLMTDVEREQLVPEIAPLLDRLTARTNPPARRTLSPSAPQRPRNIPAAASFSADW